MDAEFDVSKKSLRIFSFMNPAQDESISMNVKLKNLRSAEEDLGNFLGNVVVTSELATSICSDEVNDAYVEYVVELNNKVIAIPYSRSITVKKRP